MERVVIVSGGVIGDREFLRRIIEEAGDPVIICADGALRHVHPLGIVPTYIVGDMDSVDEEELAYCTGRGSQVRTFAAEKDETDTELALREAFALNPDEIWIVGALGGRIDHTLANIGLLVTCTKEGIQTRIIDEACAMTVIDTIYECEGRKGDTVSLLPLSSRVTGITLRGFKYPLDKATMEVGMTLGISNRLMGERGTIAVESGYLLVIHNFGREEEL